MSGLILGAMGRYEESIQNADAAIAAAEELGRTDVRVVLNYSTAPLREVYDLEEARTRSERSLGASSPHEAFHMPRMNAIVDLIETEILDGNMRDAFRRWEPVWEEALATPAWERWLLGAKLAAFRAELELAAGDAEQAATWADRGLALATEGPRRKYVAVSHAVLARALARLGHREESLEHARAAVAIADEVGNPAGRWRTRRALVEAATAGGDSATAAQAAEEATAVVKSIAEELSSERAAMFLRAPQVAEAIEG
jgi:tetratricopeptide (TPR) repeat protein